MPVKPKERRLLYSERRDKGFCPRCGRKKPKREKFIFCSDCRSFFRDYHDKMSDKLNKKRKTRYQQRKKTNRCPRCGKALGKRYDKIICSSCLKKQYRYNTGGERPSYLK